MKTIMIICAVFFTMVWAGGAHADFKEGMWEITTQVSIQGMPQSMPPVTFRQCITKSHPVPQNKDKNFECKTVSQKISGNTVHYTVECNGPEGVTETTGKTSYSDNTMSGESTTLLKIKGQPPMQMKSKIKGRYTGPCQK